MLNLVPILRKPRKPPASRPVRRRAPRRRSQAAATRGGLPADAWAAWYERQTL